jgi:hypothetical protein
VQQQLRELFDSNFLTVSQSGLDVNNHFVSLLLNPESKRNKDNFERFVSRVTELKRPISFIAKDERRNDKVKYREVIVDDGRGDIVSSDEEERILKVRAKDERRRVHGKFQRYRNEDNGSRSRSALVANLIATKSVLLERERASEEVMERAIEVALLNERNAQLKSRLRFESKARFDKHLTNNNFNDLYDIF